MIENFIKSSEYTQKLFDVDDEVLKSIEIESLNDNVPIISREVLNFMLFTAKGIRAKHSGDRYSSGIFRFISGTDCK